jgi:uncharacterized protein (TIGR03437 family)
MSRPLERIRKSAEALALCMWFAAGVSSAPAQNLTIVSSTAYAGTVAPGSAATIFGTGLANQPAAAAPDRTGSLPRSLAGVTVTVKGRAAQLAFVSGGQINFVVPRSAAEGVAEIAVLVDDQVVATGTVNIARLAPGLFTADGSGTGPGTILNAATFAGAPFPTHTVELPGCDKRTRLTLFASGVRYAGNPERLPLPTGISAIEAILEDPTGVAYPALVEQAAASETYPGVDEVRVIVPEDVAIAGDWTLRVLAEGIASNAVTVNLAPAEATALDCSAYGQAFAYSTVADLLAGDLWDVTSPAAVFADLATVPGDWEIAGVGSTALEARNGEVIGAGFAGSPELVWSDPQFPPTVRTLSDEPIPFLGVAAGNPASVVVGQAEPDVPIHQQIVDLARQNGLAFAAVRVSGRFSPVSYSVAHNLLKQGTPLTDPAADKAPYQLFFTADASAEWELSGFYAAAASVQEIVSVRGAPVHLHGFQLDRSRAGHIGSAIVENAEIRLYPLSAPTVRDADLTLSDVTVGQGQATFAVLNAGNGRVARTTVQGLVAGRVIFQVELFDLDRGEPRLVTTSLPADTGIEELEIVVDPFNDVLESDEANNYYFHVAAGQDQRLSRR